ncbi:MAG: hypothetical protein K8953_01860 [Proteobacteria bacterium]|nr:hypothetical protein [Pseudomonadota bacterium]
MPNNDTPVNNVSFIKNYGLFWKRNVVDWGNTGPGNAGGFWGMSKDGTELVEKNFREQIGFYALYDIRDNRDIHDVRDIRNDPAARDACNNPYDNGDKLIYCGNSGSGGDHALFNRIAQQRGCLPDDSWNQFSWFGIANLEPDGSLPQREPTIGGERSNFLYQMEAVMIAISRPTHNREAGIFDNAKQYLQTPPPTNN